MDETAARNVLSTIDYVVFSVMLLISALIGIYCAWRERKSKDGTEGYLMANRSMEVVPVAFSLAVSFQSSITVLGVPAETYLYGMMYVWTLVGLNLACIVASVVFLPTLYNLGISSTCEYLEKRYCRLIRLANSTFLLMQLFLYTAINIYAPALALSGVTGFGLNPAMLSTGLVCIFYTTLGGLRGVIWADVFQGIIMAAGMLSILIQGSIKVGGIQEIWRIAQETGRTDIFDFNPDPRIRYTTWTTCVGGFVFWVSLLGTYQTQVQRMLSVKSETKAIKAMWLGVAGNCFFVSCAAFCGITLFAYYRKCDPLSANCIEKRDELMPYAVMELFKDFNGMPGLFLACVFSASLSTVSSAINAMVTVSLEDFVKPNTKWTSEGYTKISKAFGVIFGAVSLGLSYLASEFDSVVGFGMASYGAYLGPTLGIFLLGIWCPFVNATGAISGYVAGTAMCMTMFVGSNSVVVPPSLERRLQVNVQECPVNCSYLDAKNVTFYNYNEIHYNNTLSHPDDGTQQLEGIENFYAMAYFYVSPVGLAATLVVGIVVSLLTGGWSRRHQVKKHLIRPPFEAKVFRWIPKRIRYILRCGISWDPQVEAADEYEIKHLAKLNEENG